MFTEMRAIIHVDLDTFFVSVEESRRPELRGKPVVVGGAGVPARRGVVSAASYEARKFGISSGMPLKTAYRMCPDAVFLPVDLKVYEAASERFMAILNEYTPEMESFGLDEAFLDVTGAGRSAVEIAQEIKRRVKEELGLSASVGIATNKLLAKMASDLNKPDGLTIIKDEDAQKILSNMPVRRLYGVGEKTEKRLRELGITTIGELAGVPLRFLQRNFGVSMGSVLYNHSRGVDGSPVVPFHERHSFSREITFQEDTGDTYLIKGMLMELARDVADRLKGEGFKGRTVSVKVRYLDFVTITRTVTLEEASNSNVDICVAVLDIFNGIDFSRKVRLVGVKVSNLTGRHKL